MPPTKKLAEVSGESVDSAAMLEELLAYKRETLAKLQQAVLVEQTTLNATKTEIDAAKRQAKTDAQIEGQKFRDGLQEQAAHLQAERKELERLDLELTSRRQDIEVLEAQAAPVAQAKQALVDERLAIEQQRTRNDELKRENDQLANATSSAHAEVEGMKAELLAERTRVQTQATEQEQRETALTIQASDLAKQLENLTALKDTLDPKIAELTALQTTATADKEQATLLRDETLQRQSELDKQKADLAIVASQLQAKADALLEFDAALKRTDAELRVKIQAAKGQGIVMSEAPTEEPKAE